MLGEPIRVDDSYALFSDVACHPLCNGKRVGLIERGGRNVYLKSKGLFPWIIPKSVCSPSKLRVYPRNQTYGHDQCVAFALLERISDLLCSISTSTSTCTIQIRFLSRSVY